MTRAVHPSAASWQLPPEGREPLPAPLRRTNLRELLARPGRFEHHLMVVASAGSVQLEAVTASEPLFFAHLNVSDEWAMALPTGDPLVDSFPLRTFLSEPEGHQDVARLAHRVGDLVLHPYGLLHWPGRLRAPYEPPPFPPGMRRALLTAVLCACETTPPGDRPLGVPAGREADAKPYGEREVPLAIADTLQRGPGVVARVGDASLELLVAPPRVAPERGGWVLVLEGSGAFFPCDLIHVPAGAGLDGAGLGRALVLSSSVREVDAPPRSWDEVPAPPFAPFERGPRGALPVELGGLSFEEAGRSRVRVALGPASAEVPRHWLARMLFRVALHGLRLGYVETYEGFFYDDRGGRVVLGLRGAGSVALDEPLAAVERLYRAVAPEGYQEHPPA